MNDQIQLILFITVIGLAIIAAIIFVIRDNIKKQKAIEGLKQRYLTSLQGTDKKLALNAGRAYFSALRGGTLTIYDEQALTNDLMAMSEPTVNLQSH